MILETTSALYKSALAFVKQNNINVRAHESSSTWSLDNEAILVQVYTSIEALPEQNGAGQKTSLT